MKKGYVLSAAGLIVVAGLGWATWWSLGTCRPLDRLLGLSCCTHSVYLVDFLPLTNATMSPTDIGGIASLVGQVRTADGCSNTCKAVRSAAISRCRA